jgi:hypothetical protein
MRNYTRLVHLHYCGDSAKVMPPMRFDLKNVLVLTNSFCGSTCALFSNHVCNCGSPRLCTKPYPTLTNESLVDGLVLERYDSSHWGLAQHVVDAVFVLSRSTSHRERRLRGHVLGVGSSGLQYYHFKYAVAQDRVRGNVLYYCVPLTQRRCCMSLVYQPTYHRQQCLVASQRPPAFVCVSARSIHQHEHITLLRPSSRSFRPKSIYTTLERRQSLPSMRGTKYLASGGHNTYTLSDSSTSTNHYHKRDSVSTQSLPFSLSLSLKALLTMEL